MHAYLHRKQANSLVKEFRGKPYYSDADASPIVFLYRHSVELYLKEIVLWCAGLVHRESLDAGWLHREGFAGIERIRRSRLRLFIKLWRFRPPLCNEGGWLDATYRRSHTQNLIEHCRVVISLAMRWAVCDITHRRFIASLLLEIKLASSSHSPMMMVTQLFRSWANIHGWGLGPGLGI